MRFLIMPFILVSFLFVLPAQATQYPLGLFKYRGKMGVTGAPKTELALLQKIGWNNVTESMSLRWCSDEQNCQELEGYYGGKAFSNEWQSLNLYCHNNKVTRQENTLSLYKEVLGRKARHMVLEVSECPPSSALVRFAEDNKDKFSWEFTLDWTWDRLN